MHAAGFYANPSIFSELDAWRGRSSAELQTDSSIFVAIYQGKRHKITIIYEEMALLNTTYTHFMKCSSSGEFTTYYLSKRFRW